MAVLKNGIFKGRVGDVSFYGRQDEQYANVFNKHSKKPASPLQKKSRTKFQFLARFGSVNKLNLIRPYWHTLAKKNKKIGYNNFIQSNLNLYIDMDNLHANLLLVPYNEILEPKISVEKLDEYFQHCQYNLRDCRSWFK